jgi:hypothetical protein
MVNISIIMVLWGLVVVVLAKREASHAYDIIKYKVLGTLRERKEIFTVTDRHFAFWPKRLPRSLTLPETNVYYNLEVSAT